MADCISAIKVINNRIVQTIDKDHKIGHAYFIELLKIEEETELIKNMKNIWLYQILPLLQDYYFMNPEDIIDILDNLVLDGSGSCIEINYNISDEEFMNAINQIKNVEG